MELNGLAVYATCVLSNQRATGLSFFASPTCQFTGNPVGVLGGWTQTNDMGFYKDGKFRGLKVKPETAKRMEFLIKYAVVPCSLYTIPLYRTLALGQCSVKSNTAAFCNFKEFE